MEGGISSRDGNQLSASPDEPFLQHHSSLKLPENNILGIMASWDVDGFDSSRTMPGTHWLCSVTQVESH